MSVFRPQVVRCPSCGDSFQFDVCKSINADRRPDLRQAILDGDFQAEACPSCGKTLRPQPSLTYIDVAHDLWALVQPADDLSRWSDLEDHARELFEQSYGAEAPELVQEIGRKIRPRVTFGWPALREKLVLADLGLDDTTLELTKLMLVRSLDDEPLADDVELRLQEADADDLVFAWVRAADDAVVETLRVPNGLYEQVALDKKGWADLREALGGGPFVDMHRLLVPPRVESDPVGA